MRSIEEMYKSATSMKFILHLVRAYHPDKAKCVTIAERTKCSVSNQSFEPGAKMYTGENSNTILSEASVDELDQFIENNREDKRVSWLLSEIETKDTTTVGR